MAAQYLFRLDGDPKLFPVENFSDVRLSYDGKILTITRSDGAVEVRNFSIDTMMGTIKEKRELKSEGDWRVVKENSGLRIVEKGTERKIINAFQRPISLSEHNPIDCFVSGDGLFYVSDDKLYMSKYSGKEMIVSLVRSPKIRQIVKIISDRPRSMFFDGNFIDTADVVGSSSLIFPHYGVSTSDNFYLIDKWGNGKVIETNVRVVKEIPYDDKYLIIYKDGRVAKFDGTKIEMYPFSVPPIEDFVIASSSKFTILLLNPSPLNHSVTIPDSSEPILFNPGPPIIPQYSLLNPYPPIFSEDSHDFWVKLNDDDRKIFRFDLSVDTDLTQVPFPDAIGIDLSEFFNHSFPINPKSTWIDLLHMFIKDKADFFFLKSQEITVKLSRVPDFPSILSCEFSFSKGKVPESLSEHPNQISHTTVSVKGTRPTMEDTHANISPIPGLEEIRSGIFAIFDGHGGDENAEYLKYKYIPTLIKNFRIENLPDSIQETVKEVETGWKQIVLNYDKERLHSGSTAVSVIIVENTGCFMNLGDAEALVVSGDSWFVLSEIHNAAKNEVERKDAIKRGATFTGSRLSIGYGASIAVTRAFGDHDIKEMKVGFSSDPFIKCVDLTGVDYIILACDGLWDVITYGDAISFCNSKFRYQVPLEEVTKDLVQYALNLGTSDNVTVTIIKLRDMITETMSPTFSATTTASLPLTPREF